MTKSFIYILSFSILCFLMTACASGQTAKTSSGGSVLGGDIGILFPSEDEESQVAQAEELKERLEDCGYEAEIAYAGSDGDTQAEQVSEMIEAKKNCLVIYPVNSASLHDALGQAAAQGISVISYNQLISNTEDVSWYVGFDNYSVGTSIAGYLVNDHRLDSLSAGDTSCSIEFFMGDPDDISQQLLFQGMMDILQPYLDSSVLDCRSLRLSYGEVSITRASGEIAAQTCTNIMRANYMDSAVDIIVVGTDDLASDIVSSLDDLGISEEDWPQILASGGTADGFARIEDGAQDLTVYYNYDNLPRLCADLIDQIIQGEEASASDTVNNGATDIDAVFGKTKLAYADNYRQVMSDAGIEIE